MKKLILVSVIIIIILFAINIYFYQFLPDRIITHWNAQGQANGTMPKFWGLFLLPIITVVIFLLFLLIPKIDPMKKNIEKSRTYYESFILIFILFMLYINIFTILLNLGINININLSLIPAIGFLFIFIGIILKNFKRNWFIGIRTPWTLSSEVVWNKTHKLGSRLFIISGAITLLGIFFPNYTIWFILAPIIISAIICIVYSYFEYQKVL